SPIQLLSQESRVVRLMNKCLLIDTGKSSTLRQAQPRHLTRCTRQRTRKTSRKAISGIDDPKVHQILEFEDSWNRDPVEQIYRAREPRLAGAWMRRYFAGGSLNVRLNARLNAASESYPTSAAISATPRGVIVNARAARRRRQPVR